ncbi:hypothetical protein RJT34_09242 [Clitoria ternatea]|uniref:non-specific serine/threonine protein kinase n=1 Tax=Clitoria ternatea TaxID=43366 RepID=A0AAN9K5F8_CLITE
MVSSEDASVQTSNRYGHGPASLLDKAFRSSSIAADSRTHRVPGHTSQVDTLLRSSTTQNSRTHTLRTPTSLLNTALRSSTIAEDSSAHHAPAHHALVDSFLRSNTPPNSGENHVHSHTSQVDGMINTSTTTISASSSQSLERRARDVEGFRLFTMAELEAATRNFSGRNRIGGDVYRGKLADGRKVAIKKKMMFQLLLKKKKMITSTTAEILSRLRHKNLIKLFGYHEGNDLRFAVYEYVENGSLHHHFHDEYNGDVLSSWRMRIKIAFDACRGIEYLHYYADPSISHGHLKPSNILLDADWTARVSDFEWSLVSTNDAYEKARSDDVYSLGVVMLELLTGKRDVAEHCDKTIPAPESISEEELKKILDPRIGAPMLKKETKAVRLLLSVAKKCVKPNSFWKMRPKVDSIVSELGKALSLCGGSPDISSGRIPVIAEHSNKAEEFPLHELVAATNNFSPDNKIGVGGFGVVYKGTLADGREVAIKRSESNSKKKIEFEDRLSVFEAELDFLSRLHHRNLVRLVGFCEDKNERLLVCEYVLNGSLYNLLHHKNKGSRLDSWKLRIQIALDACRGIEYLHNYAGHPIIHRDIKSSNILIDHNWTARVCDFGLSLTSPGYNSDYRPKKAGTRGYMDPEYRDQNVLTTKSDVYSLGVVLLELLTGKKAIFKHGKEEISLVDFASTSIQIRELEKVWDERVEPPRHHEKKALYVMGDTARLCVRSEGKHRPPIDNIVAQLKEALEVFNDRE